MDIKDYIDKFIIKNKNKQIGSYAIESSFFFKENLRISPMEIDEYLKSKTELIQVSNYTYLYKESIKNFMDKYLQIKSINLDEVISEIKQEYVVELSKLELANLIKNLSLDINIDIFPNEKINNKYEEKKIEEKRIPLDEKPKITFSELKKKGLEIGYVYEEEIEQIDFNKETDIFDKWDAREYLEECNIQIK